MPVYNNISAKYIISKMYRDLDLQDANYELDFIEWFGEALDFIGAASQFEKKTDTIIVSDFRGNLPDMFVALQQVRVKQVKVDSNSYYLKENNSSHNPKIENVWSNLAEEYYSINNNFIVTSFEEGEVQLTYLAIATDEDGYPLVPDNQYYKEALFWYCVKKMIMRGYQLKTNQISYELAEHNWRRYCTGARNSANFPDIGQYERFAQVWVGLIPPKRLFENGYNLPSEKSNDLDVVNASNLITRPLTVEKPNE